MFIRFYGIIVNLYRFATQPAKAFLEKSTAKRTKCKLMLNYTYLNIIKMIDINIH